MPEELRILEVLRVNNKSIDITLNQPITEDIEFVIEGPDGFKIENKEIVVADNSYLGPIENTKSLIFPDEKLLTLNTQYRVVVRNKIHEGYDMEFACKLFPAMVDANLEVYGDRIIKVSFEYPVRNLEKYHRTSSKLSLSNFYILYYNLDSSGSTVGSEHYLGSFQYGEGIEDRIADDYRSIEIQNSMAFPNGEHSLIINYNKDYSLNTAISDYVKEAEDYLGRTFPIVSKPFTIKSGRLPSKITSVEALSRTEVLVTFDGPVLLNLVTFANKSPFSFESDGKVIDLDGFAKTVYIKYDPITGKPIFNFTPISDFDEKIEYVDSEDGVPAVRYGSDFNQLLFNFEKNLLNALPEGESIIRISGIRDANGFLIDDFIATVNPKIVKPKVLGVYQLENDPPETTVLEVVYSVDMNSNEQNSRYFINSALNKDNYLLLDKNNEVKLIESITHKCLQTNSLAYTECDVYHIKVNPELKAGEYKLVIRNINDKLETVIDLTTIVFEGEDYTVPKVNEILAHGNRLVIFYNDPMMTIGEKSVLEASNYKVNYYEENITDNTPCKEPTKSYIVDLNSDMKDLFGDSKVVRIIPPENSLMDEFKSANYRINIGYCKVKEIKYVTNTVGNILTICFDNKIIAQIPEIDMEKGKISILENNKLVYSYINEEENALKNQFIKVDDNDLLFYINDPAVVIDEKSLVIQKAEISKDNPRELIITFEGQPFDSGVKELFLKSTENYPEGIRDLFDESVHIHDSNGNPIVKFSQVLNKIASTVKGISLGQITKEGNVEIAMKFSQEIADYSNEDFYIINNLSSYVPIVDMKYLEVDDITGMSDTLILIIDEDISVTDYNVSVAKTEEYLQTIDSNNTPIAVFKDKKVMDYSARKLYWTSTTDKNNLEASTFRVVFDVDIKLKKDYGIAVFKEYDSINKTRANIRIESLGIIEFTKSGTGIFDTSVNPGPVTGIPTVKIRGNEIIIKFTSVSHKIKANNIRRAIFKPEPYAILDAHGNCYINADNAPTAGLNM